MARACDAQVADGEIEAASGVVQALECLGAADGIERAGASGLLEQAVAAFEDGCGRLEFAIRVRGGAQLCGAADELGPRVGPRALELGARAEQSGIGLR